MHMFGYGYPGSWVWGIGMFLMMALWITVIAGIVILIVKHVRKDNDSTGKALEILDIKLAQDEISEAEYIQKRKILKEK